MSSTKSTKLQSLVSVLEDGINPMPVPSTAADGETIENWRNGSYAPDFATISIDANGAGTLTAPVELYGYDATDSRWRKLGDLNSGNDVALTATIGFEQRVRDVGVFERLAVACAVVTAVTLYTVRAKPLEVIGT